MRTLLTRIRRARRGGAVVEFGIVAMLLVPLVMYSMYFVDIAKVRIKTQEIARYAVWEMTSYPLSDYEKGNQKAHDDLFEDAARNVARDIQDRYGDDLRADTVNHSYVKYMTGDWELAGVTITPQEVAVMPSDETFDDQGVGGVIGKILEKVNGGINAFLKLWKFNVKGQAKVDVTVRFTNDFIPENHAEEFFTQDLFPNNITTLEFKDSMTMIVDAWTLFDGENVYPPGGYQPMKDGALMHAQVARITWMGLDQLPGISQLTNFLSKLSKISKGLIDNPFQTRVASIASRGKDVNAANRIIVDVDCGIEKFHTTPIREEIDTMKSEYARSFKTRGQFYMGCPKAQKLNCWGE